VVSGKWKAYNSVKEFAGDGTIDFDTDAFEMRLFLSTSNCNTLTHSVLADLTNEHAVANGYAPLTLTGVTWAQTGGSGKFDSDDAIWTAAGGDMVAHFAVIIRKGTVNGVLNALVAVCRLDVAPADKTATNGNTFEVRIAAAGILTLDGATTD